MPGTVLVTSLQDASIDRARTLVSDVQVLYFFSWTKFAWAEQSTCINCRTPTEKENHSNCKGPRLPTWTDTIVTSVQTHTFAPAWPLWNCQEHIRNLSALLVPASSILRPRRIPNAERSMWRHAWHHSWTTPCLSSIPKPQLFSNWRLVLEWWHTKISC